MAGLAAGGVLAACGAAQEAAAPTPGWRTPDPLAELPSPLPAATADPLATPLPVGTPNATPTPSDPALERFLALSAALTGFEDLDPELGRVYLDSIQAGPGAGGALDQLYAAAGAAPSVESLEQAGIFADETTRALADAIAESWYTGVYMDNGQPTVATFVDALAWQAITKPTTICGPYPGFWQEPADQEIRD